MDARGCSVGPGLQPDAFRILQVEPWAPVWLESDGESADGYAAGRRLRRPYDRRPADPVWSVYTGLDEYMSLEQREAVACCDGCASRTPLSSFVCPPAAASRSSACSTP